MLIWGSVTCADSLWGKGMHCHGNLVDLIWKNLDCVRYPNPCNKGRCLLLRVLHTIPYAASLFFRDWIGFWHIEWPDSQHGLVFINSFGVASNSFNRWLNLVQISTVLGVLCYSSCFVWNSFITETEHTLSSLEVHYSALHLCFSSSLA